MSEEAMKLALEAHGIDPSTPGLYGFYVDCISSTPQPAQQQDAVADEVRCPECGYLTKHTEHIGCLRKALKAINDFEQRNFAIVNMDKTPQPVQRKPLTEAEIADTLPGYRLTDAIDIVRAVEAKHNTKDTTL
jgi:hypothetical protein